MIGWHAQALSGARRKDRAWAWFPSLRESTLKQVWACHPAACGPWLPVNSLGICRWAVLQKGSAHEPPPENVGRERDAVGILDRRRAHAYVYTPEPPLGLCSRARHGSVREVPWWAEQGGLMTGQRGGPGRCQFLVTFEAPANC
jgi:hypothetical protein